MHQEAITRAAIRNINISQRRNEREKPHLDIYYYWDMPTYGELPEYIGLCLETWSLYAQANSITRINLQNISTLSDGLLAPERLRLFTPAQRSDAAMTVIMHRRKGLFMDADTILLPSFDPSRYVNASKPVMYARRTMDGHGAKTGFRPLLAFLATQGRDNRFMDMWRKEILMRIEREARSPYRKVRRILRTTRGHRVHVKWHYLGDAAFDTVFQEDEAEELLVQLDAEKTGFLPNINSEGYGASIFSDHWLSPQSHGRFRETDHPDGIVALQNSWFPADFKRLARPDILRQQNRIGDIFRYALT